MNEWIEKKSRTKKKRGVKLWVGGSVWNLKTRESIHGDLHGIDEQTHTRAHAHTSYCTLVDLRR